MLCAECSASTSRANSELPLSSRGCSRKPRGIPCSSRRRPHKGARCSAHSTGCRTYRTCTKPRVGGRHSRRICQPSSQCIAIPGNSHSAKKVCRCISETPQVVPDPVPSGIGNGKSKHPLELSSLTHHCSSRASREDLLIATLMYITPLMLAPSV